MIQIISRIIRAWFNLASDKLIAAAYWRGNELVVWSCSLKKYYVNKYFLPFRSVPTRLDLEDFWISDSGSRIHWDCEDVDLDLEAIQRISK